MTHPPAQPRYPRLFVALVGFLTLLVAACGDDKRPPRSRASLEMGPAKDKTAGKVSERWTEGTVEKSVDGRSDKLSDKRADRPVPGPDDASSALGIVNAPEAAPARIPAPAGFGGGTGGAIADPNGKDVGTIGGMGGQHVPGGFAGRSGGSREKMLREGGGKEPPPVKPTKPDAPKVWKRDAARPTVARVYVGDSNSLELVSMHVSVHIEGPRARTVVDHVFRNPHDKRLEGTFEYPLPAGASPSYYAMFLGATRQAQPQMFKPNSNGTPLPLPETLTPAQLARAVDASDWGKLQEARLIAPDKALEAYEEVVRGRIDPALLEYASGNTFRGRVFPIAARGYNRVLIAYEETIPVTAGRLVYRFALPTSKVHEVRFSLEASSREIDEPTFEPAEARKEVNDDRVRFTHTWADDAPKGEVTFSAAPKTPTIQATTGQARRQGAELRLRPAAARAARRPQGGAVRQTRGLPARHEPERTQRPLRRVDEADEDHPRDRHRHREVQRRRLQRRGRLGRAEGLDE